jgi:oligo-1,6-glucosidase
MKNKLNSIIYQIWPRSFNDSNEDGIGDINGIIEKLDYLKELNVDYIWISPLYSSPNTDYGYDVADYYSINPEYGSLSDLDKLIQKAKHLNIKIIMDLVANHTSTDHPWFLEAVRDSLSPKRDYYYFRESKNGKEPNNWISIFGGSAWTKVDENNYVLTLFTPHQADLNWENKQVRVEIANIMEFWINRGIAGFRLDVINTISKKEGLPSKNPQKKGFQFADDFIINRPKAVDYAREVIAEVKARTNIDFITIGEGMLMTREVAKEYSNVDNPICDMMIHFDLHMLGCGPLGKFDFRKGYRWKIIDLKRIISNWQTDMQKNNYWMANYLSNHDQPRQVSRFGNDKKYIFESAKALALLNMTLLGTPLIYQGEEIGMTNAKLEEDDWRDYEAKNAYLVLQDMMHLPAFLAKKIVMKMTRDHARTPMQWSDKPNAGFSSVNPWIKVNSNFKSINVEQQLDDEASVLSFYRKLTAFIKQTQITSLPIWKQSHVKHKHIIAYHRENDTNQYIVIINLSNKMETLSNKFRDNQVEIIIHTYDKPPLLGKKMIFRPYEGIVMKQIYNE